MRVIVQPPPSQRCELCNGELRLKAIRKDAANFDIDVQALVCVKCGHERACKAPRDPYGARAA
jgi:hypothetical protein